MDTNWELIWTLKDGTKKFLVFDTIDQLVYQVRKCVVDPDSQEILINLPPGTDHFARTIGHV